MILGKETKGGDIFIPTSRNDSSVVTVTLPSDYLLREGSRIIFPDPKEVGTRQDIMFGDIKNSVSVAGTLVDPATSEVVKSGAKNVNIKLAGPNGLATTITLKKDGKAQFSKPEELQAAIQKAHDQMKVAAQARQTAASAPGL